MSRRERRAKKRLVHLRVARRRAQRRRARSVDARRAAAVSTMSTLVLAGLPVGPVLASSSDSASGPGTASMVSNGMSGACGDSAAWGLPRELVTVRGTLFMTADDGVHGRELWKSDGTEAGTVLVRDIDLSAQQSYWADGPRDLTAVRGEVFFSVFDPAHGRGLWKSDGTRPGTVLVDDVDPSRSNDVRSGPQNLTAVAHELFFTVDHGLGGTELWSSDGTPGGTVLVKDIPVADADGYGGAQNLTPMRGELFFTIEHGLRGRELWRSDGTRGGTVRVKTLLPTRLDDGSDRDPMYATVVGKELFFAQTDGVHGTELWRSDGTPGGTVMVSDIRPRRASGEPQYLVNLAGRLFFSAADGVHGRELWSSDGSRQGTVMVADIRLGPRGSRATYIAETDGVLFFQASDGIHGDEPWTSDGTRAGTVMVRDLWPGAYGSSASQFVAMGDRVFFTAHANPDEEWHATQLWATDGTSQATVVVKDLGFDDIGYFGDLTPMKGRLFLRADDGVHGMEVWKSDGTADGTVVVKDINDGGGFLVASRTTADLEQGELALTARVETPGKLRMAAVGESPVKAAVRDLTRAGRTQLLIQPTRTGMRQLRRSLRQAHRNGDDTGTLDIAVRISFRPCDGPADSIVRRFTLQLR